MYCLLLYFYFFISLVSAYLSLSLSPSPCVCAFLCHNLLPRIWIYCRYRTDQKQNNNNSNDKTANQLHMHYEMHACFFAVVCLNDFLGYAITVETTKARFARDSCDCSKHKFVYCWYVTLHCAEFKYSMYHKDRKIYIFFIELICITTCFFRCFQHRVMCPSVSSMKLKKRQIQQLTHHTENTHTHSQITCHIQIRSQPMRIKCVDLQAAMVLIIYSMNMCARLCTHGLFQKYT